MFRFFSWAPRAFASIAAAVTLGVAIWVTLPSARETTSDITVTPDLELNGRARRSRVTDARTRGSARERAQTNESSPPMKALASESEFHFEIDDRLQALATRDDEAAETALIRHIMLGIPDRSSSGEKEWNRRYRDEQSEHTRSETKEEALRADFEEQQPYGDGRIVEVDCRDTMCRLVLETEGLDDLALLATSDWHEGIRDTRRLSSPQRAGSTLVILISVDS